MNDLIDDMDNIQNKGVELIVAWKTIRNTGLLIIAFLFLPFSLIGFSGGVVLNWMWGLNFLIGGFPVNIIFLISPIPFIFSVILFLIAILSIITAYLAKNYGNNKTISYRWIEFGIILIIIQLLYLILQIVEISINAEIVEESNTAIYLPLNLFLFLIVGFRQISKGYKSYRYTILST